MKPQKIDYLFFEEKSKETTILNYILPWIIELSKSYNNLLDYLKINSKKNHIINNKNKIIKNKKTKLHKIKVNINPDIVPPNWQYLTQDEYNDFFYKSQVGACAGGD